MAKVPDSILERLRRNAPHFPLPLEPMHGWRSSPDEGGHTHCESCRATISLGDPVVGCYLTYVSVVFCPECVRDNPELFCLLLTKTPEFDTDAPITFKS